jgi:hypothetical protein
MNEFKARPSVTVRVTVFVSSLLITLLCIGSVVIGLTWDESSQIAVTRNTPTTST